MINFVEKIAPNAELATFEKEILMFLDTLQHWAMDLEMRLQKHILLLVSQNVAEVHPALTKNADIPVVEILFPDYDERLAFDESPRWGTAGESHPIYLPADASTESQ